MFLLRFIPLAIMIFAAYLILYRQSLVKYLGIDQELLIVAVSATFMLLSILGFILILLKYMLFFWIWLAFTLIALIFIGFIAKSFKDHMK